MILLDTHVWIRLGLQPARLSKRAASAIRRAESRAGVAISVLSVWECGWLIRTGRVRVHTSPREWLATTIAATGVAISPLSTEVCCRATELPLTVPADPCDRLIVATALALGCPLITADERIRTSGCVETVW